MNKEFISYDSIRNNALKLAHKIATDGFIPDVIYVSLRGGAYLGNVMSEYFKLIRKNERPVFYAAVVARSYTDVHEHEQVRLDGWTYSPEYLRTGDKVLLVDDIFDSGRTINYLADIILKHGIPRKHLKIAVHDYKSFTYKSEVLPIQPDYWCRYHQLNSPDDECWIHYLSHELVGLTEQELLEHYYPEDPELQSILSVLKK